MAHPKFIWIFVALALHAFATPSLPAYMLADHAEDLVLRFNISTTEELASIDEAVDTLLLDVWDRKLLQKQVDIRLSKKTVPLLLGLLPQSLQHAHQPILREKELLDAIVETYPAPQGHKFIYRPDAIVPATRLHRPLLQQDSSPQMSQEGEKSQQKEVYAEKDYFFQNYQPLSSIDPWQRFMASLYSSHVRLLTIGQSYGGRDIQALRVGVHPTNREETPRPRKTVLIVGGLHAREWISTSTVNYIAFSLITGFGKDARLTRLLETFDFVLVPTLNPDGYEHTWTHDRLWRKSRQTTSTRFCPGIDLDRSFAFEWQPMENTCSESYPGDAAFAAVESHRLAAWAKNESENNNVAFVGFLDLHSYSQSILYPYSYTCHETPPGLENLAELAAGLRRAIHDVHGHEYSLMPACEENNLLRLPVSSQPASATEGGSGGSALDYFYHTMNVRYSYQLKLRDRGSYGFLLPREHIVPTGKEILNAVLFMGEFLRDIYDDGDDEVAVLADEAYGKAGGSGTIVDDSAAEGSNVFVDEPVDDMNTEAKFDLRRRRRR